MPPGPDHLTPGPQDYADFVNLSTNLVGLDRGILALQEPLSEFYRAIEGVHLLLLLLTRVTKSPVFKQACLRKWAFLGKSTFFLKMFPFL